MERTDCQAGVDGDWMNGGLGGQIPETRWRHSLLTLHGAERIRSSMVEIEVGTFMDESKSTKGKHERRKTKGAFGGLWLVQWHIHHQTRRSICRGSGVDRKETKP